MAMNWNKAMIVILMLFMVTMMLKTLSEPASIDGYSVLGEQVDEQRTTFSMVAVLGVIFGGFAIFLMVVLKRLDYRRDA